MRHAAPLHFDFASVTSMATAAVIACAGAGCRSNAAANRASDAGTSSTSATTAASSRVDPRTLGPYEKLPKHLVNRVAYVPAQCFTKTSATHNTCYTCHSEPEIPNYVDDSDLQMRLLLPEPAKKNPWTNVLSPPWLKTPRSSDADMLAYVRRTNYFAADGSIALTHSLAPDKLPAEWDENGNGKWDGYVPDAYFHFDAQGFDHAPDDSLTGWRAFAYYPFPGAFFPTNGSADDVLIRLDPALRQDESGKPNTEIAILNFAIVEALITRHDVPIDVADEAALGVDLDLDGKLGRATRVAFDATNDGNGGTRMRYVGQGRDLGKSHFFPISPGLFPLYTEFLHTVRYVDLGADGAPQMAARMKEVRYAKKLRFEDYRTAQVHAKLETEEENESLDGTHEITWEYEHGVYNKRGWELQGFIEAKDGTLRPQTFEESAACAGCHGGVGATVDSTFAFARKLSGIGDPKIAPARGWFHWSQRDLRGIPEPKRIDGEYEYSYYLKAAGAGDELRENQEILTRFFEGGSSSIPSPTALRDLHGDIALLLLPSGARALDLDRAYQAIVQAQSFDKGRDVVLAESANVYEDVPVGASTGITVSKREVRLSSNCCRNVTESQAAHPVTSRP